MASRRKSPRCEGRGLGPAPPARESGPARLLAAAGLALLAGCQAAHPGAPAAGGAPAAAALATPAHLEHFRALQAALDEDDRALAEALLERLRAAGLSPEEEGLVRSAERVLAGRALVGGLELALESQPVDERRGTFRLQLRARSSSPQALRLLLPPADLKRRRASMDQRGVEGLEYEVKLSGALADLELEPGSERCVELLTYELPIGRALAVRERWRLDPRSGEIECGGEVFPAARVRVRSCQRERLAPALAAQVVAPGALPERLEASEPPSMRALLELAVGIPAPERAATLLALAPVVARLAEADPARVATAEPALRWLTENRDLGPDAAAWARYLAQLVRADPADEERPLPKLDLPQRRIPGAPGAARR